MKIAVNTRLLIPDRLDGIGRFTGETLRLITKNHPEHQFTFIFDRKPAQQFIFQSNVTPMSIAPQARHPLLFRAWFDFSLPLLFSRIKPDLFVSPDGFLPLHSRIPSVAVIHDLNFEHYPEDLPEGIRNYYKKYFPQFARKATRIATVSEFSKQDIADKYGISPEKIDVVYNGAGAGFKPLEAGRQQLVKQQFAGGSDYFFFVGTLHPRKNLVNLFKAFDLFKKTDTQGIKLVLAGARMWWTDDIRNAYDAMEHRDQVIFTGRVSDRDLEALMASALALTYVSYFEGFGIPILEAFSSGTPVITSNITSMPEVAGDAALIVNPFSADDIARAMTTVAGNPAIRETLIAAGYRQCRRFSWQGTADRLWKCIEKAMP